MKERSFHLHAPVSREKRDQKVRVPSWGATTIYGLNKLHRVLSMAVKNFLGQQKGM
jgi:hypothetical protein